MESNDSYNFLNNKSAMIWAFDEVIGKNTEFEGITRENSKIEMKTLIKYMIKEEKFTQYVTKDILVNFEKIVDETLVDIDQYFDPESIKKTDYMSLGWPGHTIFTFFEEHDNNKYNFVLINAGEACGVHGIENELCNGILVFENVSKAKMTNYKNYYAMYYRNTEAQTDEYTEEWPYFFYAMTINIFTDDNWDFNDLNSMKNAEETISVSQNVNNNKMKCYKTRMQILGSCGFTNYLYYILYAVYKINQGEKQSLILKKFEEWYAGCKITIKRKIAEEISRKKISEQTNELHDLYMYIQMTTDDVVTIKFEPEISSIVYPDKKSSKNVSNLEFIKRKYYAGHDNKITQVISQDQLIGNIISREEIEKTIYNIYNIYNAKENRQIIEYVTKLWLLYDFNIEIHNYVTDTDNKEQVFSKIELLFLFFLLVNNMTNDNIFIVQYYYLYQLKVIIGEEIMRPLLEHLKSKFKIFETQNFLYSCMSIVLIDDQIKYYETTNEGKIAENQEIYSRFTSQFPIVHSKFVPTIMKIINDIHNKINYLPDLSGLNKRDQRELVIDCDSYKNNKRTDFYIDNGGKTVILKETDEDDNILYKLLFYNNGKISHAIYETIGYSIIEKTNEKILYDSNRENNQSFIKLQDELPYIKKRELFFTNIEQKLLKSNENEIHDNLNAYLAYYYMCEIYDKKYNDNIHKKFYDKVKIHLLSYYYSYRPFVSTFIYKNKLSYDYEKKHINIDNNILISESEKHKFKYNDSYSYTMCDSLCLSSVNFYICDGSENKKLMFYAENNTKESFDIAKIILDAFNNNHLTVNFRYEYTNNANQIIGKHKTDTMISLEYYTNEKYLKYYYDGDDKKKYYIVFKDHKLGIQEVGEQNFVLNDKTVEFYNLMRRNDPYVLLCGIHTTTTKWYIISESYKLSFESDYDVIYLYLNKLKYIVRYMNDEDLNYIYGILKLECIDTEIKIEQKNKLLCFHNKNKYDRNDENKYVDKKKMFRDSDIRLCTPHEFSDKYYYVILSKYDKFENMNTYIVKNAHDAIALMLNCISYNNISLLVQNIDQIESIINSRHELDVIKDNIFANVSSIFYYPLYELLYDDPQVVQYQYNYYNKIYEKNKIPIAKSCKINNKYEEIIDIQYDDGGADYVFFQKALSYSQEKITNMVSNFISIQASFANENIITAQMIIRTISSRVGKKYSTKKNIKYTNVDPKPFETLLKYNIDSLDDEQYRNNIESTNKMYNYLVKSAANIYPIQELLMGSGKSSVITPLLIYKLLTFINAESSGGHVILVTPKRLITQSYEILMKQLFHLVPNIDIKLEYSDSKFRNSSVVYLLDDVTYKEFFLYHSLNDDAYVIYDEVDMLANPTTCELNVPLTTKELENYDQLYVVAKIIHDIFFESTEFWNDKKYENNGVHNYLFVCDSETRKIIREYFKKTIKTYTIKTINVDLYNHIISNVLEYVLTKQYNYDYGMPETYDSSIIYKGSYKFKAIPYSGVDLPMYGSELSDPILSYVLTYLCYKFMKNKYRKIDKEFFVSNAYQEYLKDNSRASILDNFFINPVTNITEFSCHINQYLSNMRDVIDLGNESEKMLELILNKNIEYYEDCKNISFNDLLMSHNVKKFVSFTGTAYIKVPINFEHNDFGEKYIDHNPVEYRNNKFETTEELIKFLFFDNNVIRNIKVNDSGSFCDDIIDSLNDYNVLIDVGAIFVSYSIDHLLDKLQKKSDLNKKIIVYFDDGIKIVNIHTKQFVNEEHAMNKNKEILFYFGNKDITGTDAKKIMPKDAIGIITVTNKTTIRDFSQGIYRMRNILSGQKVDIAVNQKMIVNNLMIGGGLKTEEKIRDAIYNNMKKKQEEQDLINEKILLKQNIIAITKNSTSEYQQKLYIDPQSTNKLLLNINKERYGIQKDHDIDIDIDIDDYNLLVSIGIDEINKTDGHIKFVKDLFIKYNKIVGKNVMKQNKCKMQEKCIEKDIQVDIMTSDIKKNIYVKGMIATNLNYKYDDEGIDENMLSYISNSLDGSFVVTNNMNYCVINGSGFQRLLTKITQSELKSYSILSFRDHMCYGKNLDEKIITKIIVMIMLLLNDKELSAKLDGLYKSQKKEIDENIDEMKIFTNNEEIIEKYGAKKNTRNVGAENRERTGEDEGDEGDEDNHEFSGGKINIKNEDSIIKEKYLKYKRKYLMLKIHLQNKQ